MVHRTKRGTGCAVCSNKKIVHSNCLATLNPKLAEELHPTKNGNITPFDLGIGSNKLVWWKCPEGVDHEWKSAIINRHNGIGCPICSNQKIVASNSLATLNPVLAKEWHPTKNGNLTPNDVGPGSGRKVWWSCSYNNDHEWKTPIRNRHVRSHGCPFCRQNGTSWTQRSVVNKDQLKLFE